MDRLAKRAAAMAGALDEPPPAANVGDFVKVHLPCNSPEMPELTGELPWAECVAVHADGTWDGRIDNHVLTEIHGYRVDQIVRFKACDDDSDMRGLWVPMPLQ